MVEGSLEQGGAGFLTLVGEDFDASEAVDVIDGHVGVLRADAAPAGDAVAVDAVAVQEAARRARETCAATARASPAAHAPAAR